MICPTCTAQLPDHARNCNRCGATTGPQPRPQRYAGFWRRVVATLIDLFLLLPAWFLAKDYFILPASPEEQHNWYELAGDRLSQAEYQQIQLEFLQRLGELWLLTFFVCAPYYILLESSELQGTLGKLALGLRVTDLQGHKIRLGRAILRYMARPFSSLPSQLGFVLAAVPVKKRALHDFMAGTLVVRN